MGAASTVLRPRRRGRARRVLVLLTLLLLLLFERHGNFTVAAGITHLLLSLFVALIRVLLGCRRLARVLCLLWLLLLVWL